MRILFTTTNWRGMYFCLVPLGWALQSAGHDVRVSCAPSDSEAISRTGLTAVPVTEDVDLMRLERLSRYEVVKQANAGTEGWGTAGLLHPVTGEPVADIGDDDPDEFDARFREECARLFARNHDAVVEYARLWHPDLIVHDAMSGEGVLAAEVIGVPAVYCSPGLFGGNEVSLGSPAAFAKYGVARDHSLIRHSIDPTPSMITPDHGGRSWLPVRYQPYNGPGELPAWLFEEPKRPRVAIILSRGPASVFGSLPALQQAIDTTIALGAEPVITVPRRRVDTFAGYANKARVLADFPLHLLMPTSAAIIHLGSVNAIMTAAAAGLPQLAIGLTDDAVEMGRRFSATGAGLSLPGLEATGDQVSAAVGALLADTGLADAAMRVQADIAGRPTMAALVTPLEKLATGSPGQPSRWPTREPHRDRRAALPVTTDTNASPRPDARRDGSLAELKSWLLDLHGETVDADRLNYIRVELERVVAERVPGAIIELGCFRGAMTLWIRTVLDTLGDDRPIHVFDSFRGLPDTTEEDEIILPTGVMAATLEEVLATFAQWGRTPPILHPGWFEETLPTELPDQLAFAYLDGDLYSSTVISLAECVPRLANSGVLILDDYADQQANPRAVVKLPGVKLACDEYFGASSPIDVLVGEGDLAFGRYVRP